MRGLVPLSPLPLIRAATALWLVSTIVFVVVVAIVALVFPCVASAQRFELPIPPIGPTSRDQCYALNQEGLELTRRYNAEALRIQRRADVTFPKGGKEWEAEQARVTRLIEESREDFHFVMNMVSECYQAVGEYERRIGNARPQSGRPDPVDTPGRD